MRSPSSRVLANRCTIYPYVASDDADAGNDPAGNYPTASASVVPCSFQQTDAEREDSGVGLGRQTVEGRWWVMLAINQPVALNTRIDWLADDNATVVRSVYATALIDGGGRGAAFQVPCEERG